MAKGIGLDKRIGPKFLHAGPGYGGSCFPKDTLALVRTATDAGSPVRLIETTVEINDARKKAMSAKVAKGIGLDKRIGNKFLNAGPGYGGSCFPKDTLALVRTAREAGAPVELIETTVKVNDARKKAMAAKVGAALGADLKGKTVGVLGLTFKPNTDDMRDAPSLDIVPALQAQGAHVQAFDPAGLHEARQLLRDVDFKDDPYAAATGADVLVIITEWDQFRALDLDRIKLLMKTPVLVDLRNIYKPDDMRARGFAYTSVGRAAV